jgi:hypothetical protein
MLSEHLRITGRLLRLPDVAERVHASAAVLKLAFAISLAAYLLLKLAGAVVHISPTADLALLPAGVSAVGLALVARARRHDQESIESTLPARFGLLGAGLLVAFTVTYLAVNTVPVITSQDESAIVSGGHQLATGGSLRVTSPLNERYHTNVIGALHVMYRTPTEMYYRTFPGTAALYAPFSLMPAGIGYRMFTAAFGALGVLTLYLVAKKLLSSWAAALLAALVFATSPAFGHWAITVYNNVPVLALELSALAVALWAPRERAWAFGLAGALLSIAFFARVTEFVYVLPFFALVWWRTRNGRAIAAFATACAAGVALIAMTNLIFYHDALFLPHVGNGYLYLPADASQAPQPAVSAQTLLGRYGDYSTGALDSASNVDLTAQVSNLWYHFRYLASSTFAFPFVGLALLGATWRIAVGRRPTWLLATGIITVTVAVLVIYGRNANNYFGYGQPIVRSSFVRYSLPIYAMLAVATGAFALEAQRLFRGAAATGVLTIALLGTVVVAGVAKSYDADVYGFNRLNEYRHQDQLAWSSIKSVLDGQPQKPLVIGGPSIEKVIDSDYERFFINYDAIPDLVRVPMIVSVGQQAAAERPVVLLLSQSNPLDMQLLSLLYTQYRPQQILQAGEFTVETISFLPTQYKLTFVDVWNTHDALNHWRVTSDGYLESIGGDSYIALPPQLDANHDGQLDFDMTISLELLDQGSRVVSIAGLTPRSRQQVTLWSQPLGETHEWRTATVELHKGDSLQTQLVASEGLTIRSMAVTAAGTP